MYFYPAFALLHTKSEAFKLSYHKYSTILKGYSRLILFVLAAVLATACSRKKNTFITRNYHAVTAEYNALYNGDLAFDQGKEELARTYRDNYWEILPVERVNLRQEGTPDDQPDPNFERAEEKAVKAIQKHSIYLGQKEYNPQIDEAYILLGKARYFDKRFIPAMDAFNFILNKYPSSNSINQAKVWKAKTNIRLNNEDIAIEELNDMMRSVKLENEELADASAILAQAYINMDSIEAALPHIKNASSYVKNYELKGRYAFIKGQIYNVLGMKDSANMAFDEVIELNRKSPRTYMINAHIEKARNFDYDQGDRTAFLELLFDLESNRENRPFLDRIYNQIGEYYLNTENIDTAITYYNQSIRNYKNDQVLQSINYSTLAEIYFDQAEYKTAGKYYDSTISYLEENSREWRRFNKKRENLADVIKYEDIASVNDSILRIAGMSESEQLAYFTEYTEALKAKAVEDSLARVKEEQQVANNEFYQKQGGGQTQQQAGGKFYFYNPTTVAFGKQGFRKRWGDRRLEDNWRLSEKGGAIDQNTEEEVAVVETISGNELFDPQTYIARIPREEKAVDSIKKERDFAYYQLGLIYKEKFKEYSLAANRLRKLLSFEPEERLILPAKYNLYKIYQQLENTTLANRYKNDIIDNHPDSRYAEILLNPNTMLATDESSPEYKYKQLYEKFENGRYQEVIETAEGYINQYYGSDIVPKLEMLKATALARQEGFDAYKKALNFVALNYPNSDEGKQASEIYNTIIPKLESTAFITDEGSDKWKIVYSFEPSEEAAIKSLREKLEKALADGGYDQMKVSYDYYNPSTRFLIVHGLSSKLGARGFAQQLKEERKYRINHPYFEISSPNYKIVQLHKNLEDYLNTYNVK